MLKILVSVPNRGSIDPFMVADLLSFKRPLYSEITWFFPSGLTVDQARTESVLAAIHVGAEYIMFRDDDTLAPENHLTTLLARGADIAAALCTTKSKPPQPVMFGGGDVCTGWKRGDLVRCDETGLACALVRTDVFQRLSRPWFVSDSSVGEDIYFCRKAYKELGIRPIVDTSLICYHKDIETGELFFWDDNIGMGAWKTPTGIEMAVPPVGNPACPVVDLTKGANRDAEALDGTGCGCDSGGSGDGDGCGPDHHEQV